jgi:hypothetical protein
MKLSKPFSSFKRIFNSNITITQAWSMLLYDKGFWLIVILLLIWLTCK